MLEHLRADVVRVDLEGGRVDRRDDLVQLPARRERLHQRLELPHAVVLDDDAVGVVLLLDALEDVRGQTVLGLDRDESGAVVGEPLFVVFLDALLAEQQRGHFVFGEVRVGKDLLDELGLAALQKTGKDIYRNGIVSHVGFLP